jgi:outer membrane protease
MAKSAAMLALAAAIFAAGTHASRANPFIIEAEQPSFTATVGGRYWYGMGSTSKDLYGATRDTLNSRLSYTGVQTHSLEAFFRVDHESSLFWKGYLGGGLITKGNLQDEDFPPGISPYSSTNSTLQNQTLGYLSTDIGGAILRGRDFRLDSFVGYHYMHMRLKAFGCTQTATNTSVCSPSIPDSVGVIVQDNNWHSLRVGLAADIPVFDKLRLNVEGAYLPYVWLSGTDNHLLRPDLAGPIPEDGHGWGYQLEAILTYPVTDAFSIGVGGRYWHMQTKGNADFTASGGTTQPLVFKVDLYGVYLQGSYRFDGI